MKRIPALCALAMVLTMALAPSALAVEAAATTEPPKVCYPTAVIRSEDASEIRKLYDLSPEDDPAGIPRSDFEQDGFHYTLVELLKQVLPEYEERQHTETVSLASKNKDMESVLALLPQEKEFITDDGFMGTLTLRLETVQVEVAGYGSATKELTATRSYPNLAGQDTQYIPKTIEDNGKTLTLQNIDWQTDNTATTDGYALGDRYTAVATYTGSPSADIKYTGDYLTPNLAPGGMAVTGTVINGSSAAVVEPGSMLVTYPSSTAPSTGYTEVTSDLYYSAGYLGTLKIQALDLSVKVYQGTDSKTLAKGVGHFEETSIWDGNVALAAHNRGVNNYFGQIHTLSIGDKITLTTKLGTRTYKVTSVSKVSETDRSALASSTENKLTLYTCVRDQRDYRWCVQAVSV